MFRNVFERLWRHIGVGNRLGINSQPPFPFPLLAPEVPPFGGT